MKKDSEVQENKSMEAFKSIYQQNRKEMSRRAKNRFLGFFRVVGTKGWRSFLKRKKNYF